MPQESFTVVALPYSRSETRPFHVSLFVAPALEPDGPEGVLGDFEHWVRWTEALQSAEIGLFNQSGTLAVRPLLEELDVSAWEAIFPPDVPVRGRQTPDWSDRHWRTFRASEVHDTAKLFHFFSMATSPTGLPKPDPKSDLMTVLAAVLARSLADDRRVYDESVITEALDRRVLEPHVSDRVSLSTVEKRIGATQGLERAVLELHRARRFYERPEAQVPYRRRPVEGATSPRPEKVKPDFHERLSLLGDHPALLRKLGLVVDLQVDDLGALASSQFLRARLAFPGGLSGADPETNVEVAGQDMVVPSNSEEWAEGRLRVGDEARYQVLDMDADGAALKTDRFLWTVPRLAEVSESGAAASTATPAQRTGGFTLVRAGRATATQTRMSGQTAIRTTLVGGGTPRLDAEDVIQGLRFEVWDDETRSWYSLHRRRSRVEVLGHGTVLEDVGDEGFTQGTATTETAGVEDSPVHVHEAVVSWGGWSLAAARPGKRVRHENGDEIVEDSTADPDPSTPVLIHTSVETGTLPRLRYGRSYAFRAWAVDLAGNSRPHDLGPVRRLSRRLVSSVTSALTRVHAERPSAGTVGAPALAEAVRATAGSVVLHRRTSVRAPKSVDDASLGFDRASLDRDVLGRLRERRSATTTRMGLAENLASVNRSALVDRAFEDLVLETERPILESAASRVPEVIASAMDREDDPARAVDTVTALRPFLRWEPIQPPAVVSRHGNSPGESLLQLVIRSGVEQDRETLELTVVAPPDYSDAHPGLRYRATSERHLAPPKTSQSEAELHGMFDFAIGSTDPADHAAAVAWIARESGTLFDVAVPRLDDPHTLDPQPGIALVKDPGTPDSILKTLPLPTGEMPAPGQYIVHDVDALRLPYLPDPLGRGISLVFPDAGRDRQLQFPFGGEGFTAPYPGSWPALEPFRLILASSSHLRGDLTGRDLTIGLPPGDTQRFRLSSSLGAEDLELFGFWRLLPQEFRDAPGIAEATKDGWLWAFTPYDQLTLVHAVPRPLEIPRPTALAAGRAPGSTDSTLGGAIDVHGPSTEQITAAAAWTEYTDDLSLPGPETSEREAVAFVTRIQPQEDLAVLFGGISADIDIPIPNFGPVRLHRAVHQWGDTRHRTVSYRFRASTRFREYFDPSTLAPTSEPGEDDGVRPRLPDDGQSTVGPVHTVSVPSSARPAAPIVHSILPLFRWETGTEPEQPVGIRRSRRAGVRIYLERPWYSSGEGELLGVVLAPKGVDSGIEDLVSQWGQDPVWRSTPVQNRAMAFELDDLMHIWKLDDRPAAARPVTTPVSLPYAGVKGEPNVTVLGYQPEYNAERGLWFVDIAIDPGDRIWPFVRLVICRYQPDSLPGMSLSPPVLCDYQQLLPERTASVSRTDVRHVRVVVSGAIGTRGGGTKEPFPPDAPSRHEKIRRNRLMVARLQRADAAIPTDLGWDTVDTVELVVRGTGRTPAEAAWVGELEAPEDVHLVRPGANPDWRVLIEEWELLPGDPDTGTITAVPLPSWRRRLVYAEALNL
jgi:hypothetical protein